MTHAWDANRRRGTEEGISSPRWRSGRVGAGREPSQGAEPGVRGRRRGLPGRRRRRGLPLPCGRVFGSEAEAVLEIEESEVEAVELLDRRAACAGRREATNGVTVPF